YFMDRYGTYLDPEMIRNLLQTDRRESMELMGVALAARLLWHAGPPIVFLAWVELVPTPGKRGWMIRVASVLAATLLAAVAIAASYQGIATLMRNQPDLRHLITPGNYLVSLARVAASDDRGRIREPVGLDARVAPA